MEPERLAFTIAEVVKAAAVSRTELYRAIGRGELTMRKRGKRSLILVDELRRWLANLPKAPASEPSAPAMSKPRGCKALNSAPKIFTRTK